jgi:nitroreductase
MSKSSNPLHDMTDAMRSAIGEQPRPDKSFPEKVLPAFKQVLHSRRAMREFDGQPVPEAVMRDCLQDAMLAPSSSNLQTWQLYWVRDEEKRASVAKACLGQPAALTAGELVVVVARGDLWDRNRKKLIDIMTRGGSVALPGPAADYYNRIVPMLLRNDRLGFNNLIRRIVFWYKSWREPTMRTPVNRADHRIYAHMQAALAAQTLMLSITAHGYDSCPIGGMDCEWIRKALALPSTAEVSLVVAVGNGKPEGLYGPRTRLPVDDLVKEV